MTTLIISVGLVLAAALLFWLLYTVALPYYWEYACPRCGYRNSGR